MNKRLRRVSRPAASRAARGDDVLVTPTGTKAADRPLPTFREVIGAVVLAFAVGEPLSPPGLSRENLVVAGPDPAIAPRFWNSIKK
jgi:hypothetical protein